MPESANEEMLQDRAHDAAEAIRTLNHRTRGAIAAPQAYEVLASLSQLSHRLPQLFEQLGDGLCRSLDEYEVVDDKREPAVSVAMARAALDEAATHAHNLARLLDDAQGAISQQGYRSTARQVHRVQARQLNPGAVEHRPAPYDPPPRSQSDPPALEGP